MSSSSDGGRSNSNFSSASSVEVVHVEQICGVNELLGIQHLLTGKSISATAIALEPTTVLEISREDFN